MVGGDGLSSEWSEGTFKMVRLHDIQVLINHYKTYPTLMSEGKFNYQHWYQQILNLRDEGDSKYTTDEKKDCDNKEEEIESFIKLTNPTIKINEGRIGADNVKYLINKEGLDTLIKKIRKYEQTVKYYNDKHGLTTRNVDFEDDGL